MKVPSRYEKEFIINCIVNREKRLDGRDLSSGRTLSIQFSEKRDTAIAELGNTKVLSKVTAEITVPRDMNPTEGIIRSFFEPSPIASPDSKVRNKSSDDYIEIQRALEKCIRDSRCVDVESLCIIGGLKVWTITVYIHALNDDGNLLECASIAAISALANFRRPEVAVVGQQACVYAADARDPIPLTLHHMPLIICLGLYKTGKYVVIDPTYIEEEAADGCIFCCVNAHQEVIFIRHQGALLLTEEVECKCQEMAIRRAEYITKEIRTALSDDSYKLATKEPRGFVNMLQTDTILGAKIPKINVNLTCAKETVSGEPEVVTIQDSDLSDVGEAEEPSTSGVAVASSAKERALRILKESEVTVFQGGSSKWEVHQSSGSEQDESSDYEEGGDTGSGISKDKSYSKNESPVYYSKMKASTTKEERTSESEEETAYVTEEQVDVKTPASRGWYTRDPFFK